MDKVHSFCKIEVGGMFREHWVLKGRSAVATKFATNSSINETLHFTHRVYSCVSYDSQNNSNYIPEWKFVMGM